MIKRLGRRSVQFKNNKIHVRLLLFVTPGCDGENLANVGDVVRFASEDWGIFFLPSTFYLFFNQRSLTSPQLYVWVAREAGKGEGSTAHGR